jgi:hypothetical protein
VVEEGIVVEVMVESAAAELPDRKEGMMRDTRCDDNSFHFSDYQSM